MESFSFYRIIKSFFAPLWMPFVVQAPFEAPSVELPYQVGCTGVTTAEGEE